MALTKVSTDGVKDDAINSNKIPANAVGASELADNAVDTNAIANNAVTAGKLASGVQTTINNNAATRVILGSASANTLNASSNFVFNSGKLGIGTSSPSQELTVAGSDPVISVQEASVSSQVDIGTGTSTGFINIQKADGTRTVQLSGSTDSYFTGGNLGVGINNPTTLLHLKVNQQTAKMITLNGDDARNNYIGINGGDNLEIAADEDAAGSSSSIRFRVDGTERMRIDSGGLKFGTDTADANALDDYEEGTWTPTYLFNGSNTATYTYRSGSYTKIGNFVFAKFAVDISSRGSGSGRMDIGGLPFTIADKLSTTGQEVGGMITYFNEIDFNVSMIGFWGQNGESAVRLQYTSGSGNNTIQQYLQKSQINDSTGFRGYIIYNA